MRLRRDPADGAAQIAEGRRQIRPVHSLRCGSAAVTDVNRFMSEPVAAVAG